MTPNAPRPRALLLNLGADSPKGAAVHAVLAQAGVTAIDITDNQLGCVVGQLAGLPAFATADSHETRTCTTSAARPSEEFMLLCNLPDDTAMAVLRNMRAAGCPVGCKAMLTEYNRAWPLIQLVQEVCEEHAAMARLRAERASDAR